MLITISFSGKYVYCPWAWTVWVSYRSRASAVLCWN